MPRGRWLGFPAIPTLVQIPYRMDEEKLTTPPAATEPAATANGEAVKDTKPQVKKFGTFQGVFTPTLLTILGVIMYLRSHWVVGNAGCWARLA